MPARQITDGTYPAIRDSPAPVLQVVESTPLVRRPDRYEYPEDPVQVREFTEKADPASFQQPQFQQSQLFSKLVFFSEIITYAGLLFCIAGEVVHYVYLLPVPNDISQPKDFEYPHALVIALFSIGLGFYTIAGAFRVSQIEDENKGMWWVGFVGSLLALFQPALVGFKQEDFVNSLMKGRLEVTEYYIAVYAITCISMALLLPALAVVHIFGPEMRKAKYYRLMIVTGVFTIQLSMIVAIHSLVVHVGLAMFLCGIAVTLIGYLSGLVEAKKRRGIYYGDDNL
jgi:uncharacterized membrane protein